MTKSIRNGLLFIGAGVFCLLLGMGLNESSVKEKNVKYFLLFAGLSIISLYLGLSWKRPTYGGGAVHKYAAVSLGILFGIYSIYLVTKLI